MPGIIARDLFGDCQSYEEELEFARHLAEQGEEAGFSPEEIEAAKRHIPWVTRKIDGEAVDLLLGELPTGHRFTLCNVARAYVATYEKNEGGTWDQTEAPEKPFVHHMEAEDLGFCVGLKAIEKRVDHA